MQDSLAVADSMRADPSWEQNGLLASIGAEERSYLSGAATIVELRLGDLLPRPGEKAEHVWFPLSGMVSLAISFKDGQTIEVGLVGREGVVGLSPLLDGRDPVDEAVVQLPGHALRVKCGAFRELLERDRSTMSELLRYAHDLFALVSQTAACNLRHALRPRLARLILQSHDRSEGGAMPLTQKSLATMLGVPRTSVSDAAQQLQAQGAIQYARGRLTVINRAILEQLSCECYEAVQARIGVAASMLDARAPQSARRAPFSGNSRPLL